MAVYRVFNQNNAQVEVTDADLDEAAAGSGPLTVQIANAAGRARHTGLTRRLHETLTAPERRARLAAARALLALGDKGAVERLREAAGRDADPVTAAMLRALALRLESIESVRRAMAAGDEDPTLAAMLASIYNGVFDLEAGDLALILDLIDLYLAGSAGWIKAMSKDDWRNDLYVLVNALTRDGARPLLTAASGRTRETLARIAASRADRDSKKAAQKLLAALS